jgi:hypothetical protein
MCDHYELVWVTTQPIAFNRRSGPKGYAGPGEDLYPRLTDWFEARPASDAVCPGCGGSAARCYTRTQRRLLQGESRKITPDFPGLANKG